jgi:hypothetical protein
MIVLINKSILQIKLATQEKMISKIASASWTPAQ